MKTKTLAVLIAICLIVALPFATVIQTAKATTYYTYWFYGPISLEPAGEVDPTDTISVYVYWANNTVYSFNSSVANTYETKIVSTNQIHQVTWNASSASNITSTITIIPISNSSTQYFDLFVPNPDSPAYQYNFQVTDLAGITNAYLQVHANINGIGDNLVYCISLDDVGIPSFYLQQYNTYTLSVVCDQGTYSEQFTANNVLTNSINILSTSFKHDVTVMPTASAVRSNPTVLITYNDPNATTTSLTVLLCHDSGGTRIIDFSDTPDSNTYSSNITGLISTTDYYTQIDAVSNGVTYSWTLPLPTIEVGTNPFAGLFDFLGTWETPVGAISLEQLIPAAIICCALVVGSFRSVGFSCFFAWIISGILAVMGWWTISVPFFVLAGFFSIIVVLQEAKEQRGDM